MRVLGRSIPAWTLLPPALGLATALGAVLAAAALDVFVRRPPVGGGSITTLLPGFVYASATVMKVCSAGVPVSAAFVLAWFALVRDRPGPDPPVWGFLSIAMTPWTPLIGGLVVVVTQRLFGGPSVTAPDDISKLSRNGVLVMLAILFAGAAASAVSLVRRERPGIVPFLGLALNAALIILFFRFEFHAPGFDQDTWAPR